MRSRQFWVTSRSFEFATFAVPSSLQQIVKNASRITTRAKCTSGSRPSGRRRRPSRSGWTRKPRLRLPLQLTEGLTEEGRSHGAPLGTGAGPEVGAERGGAPHTLATETEREMTGGATGEAAESGTPIDVTIVTEIGTATTIETGTGGGGTTTGTGTEATDETRREIGSAAPLGSSGKENYSGRKTFLRMFDSSPILLARHPLVVCVVSLEASLSHFLR
mmetsp:Transcript_55176/g.107930  ORF Transcript_55176/g.107930 Transcript_55176/m.107930 type:complete len:219 (+) Transcript_55176:918-1574(+)